MSCPRCGAAMVVLFTNPTRHVMRCTECGDLAPVPAHHEVRAAGTPTLPGLEDDES